MKDPAAEIERRLAALRDNPEALMRYDVDGSGDLDDEEWELLRRIVATEVAHGIIREGSPHANVAPLTGLLHNRFEIVGLLGSGGQGRTWLAKDRAAILDDDRLVALKELSIGRVCDWKSVELFEREGRALESIDHPSIPRYIDAFHETVDEEGAEGADTGPRLFMVQQYVDGIALDDDLEHHQWSEEEAIELLRGVLDILEYLHELSPPIVHRDIKPSNLMRLKSGGIALIDFGAVSTVSPTMTGGSTIIGTSGYMPLEQYMGRAVPATDLYALGVTAVHLLSRRHPVDLPLERSRIQFEQSTNISEGLSDILRKLLSPSVEDRYGSAVEVSEALDALESDKKVASRALIQQPEQAIDRTTTEPNQSAVLANQVRGVWDILRSRGLLPTTWTRWLGIIALSGLTIQIAMFASPRLGRYDVAMEAINSCPAMVAILGDDIEQSFFGWAGPNFWFSGDWGSGDGARSGSDVVDDQYDRGGWTMRVSGNRRGGRFSFSFAGEVAPTELIAANLRVQGVDYRVVPCDGSVRDDNITCNGSSCWTTGPLPHELDEWVQWDPCDGEGFIYSGQIDFEQCCDWVAIGGVEHTGSHQGISGLVAGPTRIEIHTDGSVDSFGLERLEASCDGEFDSPHLDCQGDFCRSPVSPLPHNLDVTMVWDPCDGELFGFSGSIDFEPNYDYLAIGEVTYDGYDSTVRGLATGPASIRIHTDGSANSDGVRNLTAICGVSDIRDEFSNSTNIQCEGQICRTSESPLPHNMRESTLWDPCDGGSFWYNGHGGFEPDYDYVSVGPERYDGQPASIAGTSTGPVMIRVFTDSSVNSAGLTRLTAGCTSQ